MAATISKPPSKPLQALKLKRLRWLKFSVSSYYMLRIQLSSGKYIIIFPSIQIPYLKVLLCLSSHILFRNICPLVIQFLTTGKADLHFHKASFEVDL